MDTTISQTPAIFLHYTDARELVRSVPSSSTLGLDDIVRLSTYNADISTAAETIRADLKQAST